MSSMTDASKIGVVPTGVNLRQFRRAREDARAANATEPLVIFVGSMDWEANVDAMDYFCREIWPSIKAAVPAARLRIVGRNPHARVKKLASGSIEVTGTVASVVEHYQEAAVNIVPLRVGGGTRLKIYEAMAIGKATVSTSIGAEGLDVNDGRDILIADSSESFADSVIALLTDASRRERIEKAAEAQAARYDWPVIADRFEEVLTHVPRFAVERDAVESMHPGAAVGRRPGSRFKDESATEGPYRV